MRKKKKTKKGQKDDDNCFALNAGYNAAIEEIQAEERDIRRVQAEEEFHSKIRLQLCYREFNILA